jgi:hypothetical protein
MSESRPTAASAEDRLDRDAAEAALDVAVRAPSIHNTQPWRWVFDGEALTLLADRSRQLRGSRSVWTLIVDQLWRGSPVDRIGTARGRLASGVRVVSGSG